MANGTVELVSELRECIEGRRRAAKKFVEALKELEDHGKKLLSLVNESKESHEEICPVLLEALAAEALPQGLGDASRVVRVPQEGPAPFFIVL